MGGWRADAARGPSEELGGVVVERVDLQVVPAHDAAHQRRLRPKRQRHPVHEARAVSGGHSAAAAHGAGRRSQALEGARVYVGLTTVWTATAIETVGPAFFPPARQGVHAAIGDAQSTTTDDDSA